MDSQIHRHHRNFKFAIRILLNIKKNNHKLDSDFDLYKDMLQLWVCTPVGMGYIKKRAQDYYIITEKRQRRAALASCVAQRV
jgi:hypothetical protein